MKISEEYNEQIRLALVHLVEQGLSAKDAELAQGCASQMFRLIAEHQEAGIVALGLVGALIESLLEE